MPFNAGDKAPNFTAPTDGDGELSLSDLQGQNIILYFYPKDDTSGCTAEAIDFKAHLQEFEDLNTRIIGLSKDPVKKHDKFKEKYELPFTLISDESTEICQAYEAWVEKSMYGRKYMGIDRSTFLIDAQGNIQKEWRKVKVTGHAEEVLEEVKKLAR